MKKAKGDVEGYNRHRWGMNFQVAMQDEDGTDVLCPPVFWKWNSGAEEKSGETKLQ